MQNKVVRGFTNAQQITNGVNLSTPLKEVPRIGPVYQKRLKRMGITSVRDLLFHFPRRYEDLSVITPIAQAKDAGEYCFRGELQGLKENRTFKKRMSLVQGILSDKTGSIKVIWFNQPYLLEFFKPGDEVYLAGKVVRDKYGTYLSNPQFEKERTFSFQRSLNHKSFHPIHMGRIVPVYEEARGVSSKWLRSIIFSLLKSLGSLPDSLPPEIVREHKLPSFQKALWNIHFPKTLKEAEEARKRFSFEELFSISLFILTERKKLDRVKAPAVPFEETLMKRFTNKLPFSLTAAQKKAAWHILKDLEKPRPMNRLLQGDVGSGKTVVAAMATLAAVKGGWQIAFMAPTEILAQQHFKTVGSLLAPFRITIGLLTGKSDRFISPKLPSDSIEISRKKLLERAKEGSIDVLVGTHALIQDRVRFKNLALIIIDEQHRFGVQQRAKLQRDYHNDNDYDKSPRRSVSRSSSLLIPHFLSMSATPIPRTLAMTLYGDLDPTVIDELPKGRKRVQTKIIQPEERKKAYEFLRKQLKEGRQAFVICPRIEENSKSQIPNSKQITNHKFQIPNQDWAEVKSVKTEYEKLAKDVFPEFEVAMLHGKMGKDKERVMMRFKRGRTNILVSTSVVEVGVDIPNATVMLIEGAELFGLAQLHQFRGRVGRGEHQSTCLLFTESDSQKTKQRLQALLEAKNGFELAEYDFKLRGPGDFAGKKQWGMPDFAMENLANTQLVEKAKNAAQELLEKDLSLKTYPLLKEKVQELSERLHLE